MRSIGINSYLIVSGILFTIGILGIILNRRNLIALFMAIELILLAVTINFVTFSLYHKDMVGQVFSLFILTVAAAETAIGLAILVSYFRQRSTINTSDLHNLHEEAASCPQNA